MRAFQSTYVGRNDLPKSLLDIVLQQWFTFNARDRHAIRKEFRSRHRIGAALQLGFVGMTGTTLNSLEYVPAAVLRHLGRQFRQPVPDIATLRTLYRRRRTRFAHQQWAIEQRGLRDFDPAAERHVRQHLHSRTQATLSRGRLEQAAREWLYRAYVAIPGRRTITILVRDVIKSVAQEDHRDLRRYMVSGWRSHLDALTRVGLGRQLYFGHADARFSYRSVPERDLDTFQELGAEKVRLNQGEQRVCGGAVHVHGAVAAVRC